MRKMKIIDLLCLISNGEEVPQTIKVGNLKLYWDGTKYWNEDGLNQLSEVIGNDAYSLNREIEILDEEDEDIPLIPDDELIILKQSKTVDMQYAIDFNFKVLKEKINQVVEEFNEYRKEGK